MSDKGEIYNRIEALNRGESLVYYTGFLAKDAEVNRDIRAMSARFDSRLAYERGLCNLVQRRVAPFVWDYIAQRR